MSGPKCITTPDGTKCWYQNHQFHRLDGPAIEYTDGYKVWYQEGLCHRLDGPAVERTDGTKFWYQEGKRHRLDGPAVEQADGSKEWYIDGKEFTKEEFNQDPLVIEYRKQQEILNNQQIDKIIQQPPSILLSFLDDIGER